MNREGVIRNPRTRTTRARHRRSGRRLRLRRVRAAARWLARALRRMRMRARLRRDLERLDERMLRDMGATHTDLQREADKPFWRR